MKPANSVCAVPPATTVPLPSIATAPPVLMTGSGAVGPTGVAMPPTTAAGACTGTRLPATSACVDIGCVLWFASLTRSVNSRSPSERYKSTRHPLASHRVMVKGCLVSGRTLVMLVQPLLGSDAGRESSGDRRSSLALQIERADDRRAQIDGAGGSAEISAAFRANRQRPCQAIETS